jgi:hypothetical protein
MMEKPTDNRAVPISNARSARIHSDKKIETTPEELKELLLQVVSSEVSEKISRLQTSMDRVVEQFEVYRSGKSDEAALMVTTDSTATDIASANINLPVEEYYPYTAGMLAEKLGINRHQVVEQIKLQELRGDPRYHIAIAAGPKSSIQKWSEETYKKLKSSIGNT